MTNKLFRPIAFTGVAIFVATLTLTTSRMQARAADSTPPAPPHFWTEIADPAHAPKAQTMPDFVDLAAKLSPAVVNISTDEADTPAESVGPSPEDSPHSPLDPHSHGPLEEFGGAPHAKALGSGFIITKDGYILTNEHVVDSPGKVTVTTQDGRNYIAKIVGHDEKSDIALLKIEAKHDLAVAPLGNSEDLRVGEWVMAIGNPFGFDHSVTAGIVSAKGRFIPGNYEDFIQTDASINPGNSGGPLIDLKGDVIGVNCAIYTHTGASMGIGFAVPIDLVKEELPQLKASGKVVRGWLGVYIQKVTPELAESLGLADSRGALVANVLPNGPAQAAGVKRGDVIVAFDNQPVDDSRESDLGAVSPFGLHVKDLSPDLAKELGLDAPGGVVIASVQPGSRADAAGLRARDVIIEVNRAAVKNVDAYQTAVKASAKGKSVLLLIKRGDNTIYVPVKPEA